MSCSYSAETWTSWSPTWTNWRLSTWGVSDLMYAGLVSNAEVLQRSGLSTIGDILRHRRLSLFGHVARLDTSTGTRCSASGGGYLWQWCGLRPSVLGQDRSETKKSVLVLVLVLQIWCYFVKHDLVTLIVTMKVKDTTTFQVLFIVSLFCVWNITTVEINSGVHLLKS